MLSAESVLKPSFTVLNSYLGSSHPIVQTVILIAINPETFSVNIFANKQLLTTNSQACNADTICCCAFKLKLIIDLVYLICSETVFKFIKTPGNGCSSFSIAFNINSATVPILWTIVFIGMRTKIFVFTRSYVDTIFILKQGICVMRATFGW